MIPEKGCRHKPHPTKQTLSKGKKSSYRTKKNVRRLRLLLREEIGFEEELMSLNFTLIL